MSEPIANLARLRGFIEDFSRLMEKNLSEPAVVELGSALLKSLVSHDDWLPSEFAQPDPDRYQQFLVHADPLGRFSVVSFVWGPGQRTPIHDHRVWGLIGMLRGSEQSQGFSASAQGFVADGVPITLNPGDVEVVSPRVGDIHQVSNTFADRISISIHVYGANIGAVRRATYTLDGSEKSFISGYSNRFLPNVWDLSKE